MNQQDEDFRMWARAAELGSGWAGGVGGTEHRKDTRRLL